MRRGRGLSPGYCIMFWDLRSPRSLLLILTPCEKKQNIKVNADVWRRPRYNSTRRRVAAGLTWSAVAASVWAVVWASCAVITALVVGDGFGVAHPFAPLKMLWRQRREEMLQHLSFLSHEWWKKQDKLQSVLPLFSMFCSMMLYCICAAISLGIGGKLGGCFQLGMSRGSAMAPPLAALFLMLAWMSCVVAYGMGSYVAAESPPGLT